MIDDGFTAIGRDGAQLVKVALRVQRVLGEIGEIGASGDATTSAAAGRHADLALRRARKACDFAPDLEWCITPNVWC